ncbi:hypothetical protein [Metallosphaera hakonensis]|uniref:hypothetical protein n=1 Tax=Metallosphaera hakonensis TaxID=79601 RepID=UPI000AF10ADF|nr:hypothetical protein [Metallosphaera hakonensis]
MVGADPSEWKELRKIKDLFVVECHIIEMEGKHHVIGAVEFVPVINEDGLLTFASVDRIMEKVDSTRLKHVEDVKVTERTKLSQCLSKYPAQWIDDICKALKIQGRVKDEKIDKIVELYLKDLNKVLEKLPREALEILGLMLKKGGIVKYSELSRKYMDDTTFFHHQPKTPLGILRFYCLVFVGKMNMNGKNYRVAIIPSDLREKLKEYVG